MVKSVAEAPKAGRYELSQLRSLEAEAIHIIREVAAPNLKLMFDCYHVQIIEGDVTRRFESLLPLIGHVQIASVPDRGKPDHGELDFAFVLTRIAALGWPGPIGAEYLPESATPDMAWLTRYAPLHRGSQE